MQTNYFVDRKMRPIGFCNAFAIEVHRLIEHAPLIEDFTIAEITELGHFMPVYEADAGTCIIGEGEVGDFMILIVSGSIDVARRDRQGLPSRIAVVQAGHSVGEMSMLDGEPRFASCIALELTRFAVLTRETLTEVIETRPHLGARILVKLVHILAQRLRNTSTKLVAVQDLHR
jgi:CRP/FNR family cyclic AMP-dependent transcriptional regulator